MADTVVVLMVKREEREDIAAQGMRQIEEGPVKAYINCLPFDSTAEM